MVATMSRHGVLLGTFVLGALLIGGPALAQCETGTRGAVDGRPNEPAA